MKINKTYLILLFLGLTMWSCGSKDDLEAAIKKILVNSQQDAAIAIKDFRRGELTFINAEEALPVSSMFHYFIACKILNERDHGVLDLAQSIEIKNENIREDNWSPMREELGTDIHSVRLDSLIYFAVSLGDENAASVLMEKAGGAMAVVDYMKGLDVGKFIISDESDLQNLGEVKSKILASPSTLLGVLEKFYLREYLSGGSHDFLWAAMSRSSLGKEHLKSGLSISANLTHISQNPDETKEAQWMDDAGFLSFPEGGNYVYVVWVKKSSAELYSDIALIMTEYN